MMESPAGEYGFAIRTEREPHPGGWDICRAASAQRVALARQDRFPTLEYGAIENFELEIEPNGGVE